MDALAKANVDINFIEKLKNYLNNPMYSVVLPLVGINKQEALKKLNSLESMMKNNSTNSNEFIKSPVETEQTDDLEKFKRGLKSFK